MSRAQLTSTVEQNTGGAVSPYVAGKNKIINGDFGIWQRGTSFTPAAAIGVYTTDRWNVSRDGSGESVAVDLWPTGRHASIRILVCIPAGAAWRPSVGHHTRCRVAAGVHRRRLGRAGVAIAGCLRLRCLR